MDFGFADGKEEKIRERRSLGLYRHNTVRVIDEIAPPFLSQVNNLANTEPLAPAVTPPCRSVAPILSEEG